MEFSIVRKGYDIEQVDKYIISLKNKHEADIVAQKSHIDRLSTKISEIEYKYNTLKGKEDSISLAIINAGDKAKEIDDVIKAKLKLEQNRLDLFKAGWENYIKNIFQSPELEKISYAVMSYIELAKEDLEKAISRDFYLETNLSPFKDELKAESQRLTAKSYMSTY